ncbi:MAG: porin [Pseudomonadota bacterium]
MQKKIVALAVAAAFSAPAFADSNVVVYGKLSADVESVRASSVNGAANVNPTSRSRVSSNASRFGIKGSEDVADGLQAIYQVESRVNLVGNETGGGGGIFSGLRNSNVGLKGGFGTLFVGHWDTPFKSAHNKVELFDNSTIATTTALLGNPGTGTNFNQRYNSSIQYWSPDLNGFQVKLDYSTANTIANTSANQKPNLFSLSAAYDANGIYAAYAYEQHKDLRWNGTALAGQGLGEKGHRAVLGYSFGDAMIGATYEQLTVDTGVVAGAVQNTKRKAAEVSGSYKFGSSSIGAAYAKVGTFGTIQGATQASLRYGYNFSKRTELFALYTQINNKGTVGAATASNYNFVDVPAFTGAARGSKVSGFGLGVQHSF